MRLVNRDCDYHLHSLNYSDGLNTIEELVQHAGRRGLKGIAITDHSDAWAEAYGVPPRTSRNALRRWRNVHNEVSVRFGVEADLLNEAGDISDTIASLRGGYVILSAHTGIYQGEPKAVTEAYLNAIRRHRHISLLGHVDAIYFALYVDVERVIREANEHGIVVELNAKNFENGGTTHLTQRILSEADQVMVNSDAHCLADFDKRDEVLRYLEREGHI
ncbi:PHP domain-containing protein [Candidatus Woesearchaeota archaeon]|nr:PHP domain-containing protein [Candidatus Woesearchaeota archaeon]